MRSLGHFSDMSWWHWRVQEWTVNVWRHWEWIWIDDVWMHECIWIECVNAWVRLKEFWNVNVWVQVESYAEKVFMNSKNLEWSFQKTTEFFSESCVLWTLLLWETFIESFRTVVNRFELWTGPSLEWLLFWVVDYVTVNSRHVVVFWFVDRLTSRRWLPVSLNDDNRPRTRHHVRWLNGCWSSEGGKSDRSVIVAYHWVVKEVFLEKDLWILNVWTNLQFSCLFISGSRPRETAKKKSKTATWFSPAFVSCLLWFVFFCCYSTSERASKRVELFRTWELVCGIAFA